VRSAGANRVGPHGHRHNELCRFELCGDKQGYAGTEGGIITRAQYTRTEYERISVTGGRRLSGHVLGMHIYIIYTPVHGALIALCIVCAVRMGPCTRVQGPNARTK
jgi:hypothetical protein